MSLIGINCTSNESKHIASRRMTKLIRGSAITLQPGTEPMRLEKDSSGRPHIGVEYTSGSFQGIKGGTRNQEYAPFIAHREWLYVREAWRIQDGFVTYREFDGEEGDWWQPVLMTELMSCLLIQVDNIALVPATTLTGSQVMAASDSMFPSDDFALGLEKLYNMKWAARGAPLYVQPWCWVCDIVGVKAYPEKCVEANDEIVALTKIPFGKVVNKR